MSNIKTSINKLWNSTIFRACMLILIALISFFPIANRATSVETHEATISALDDKKQTVLELTGASTAASAAITLLPGDVGTPIADKLADLSGYFLFILGALYLEKYLVTITGYLAFKVLIPVACALLFLTVTVFKDSETLKRIAIKIFAFSILIYSVIPVSVKISDMIDATYQESIEETIDNAKDTATTIDENTSSDEDNSDISSKSKDDASDNFFSSLFDKASNTVSDTIDTVTNTVSTSTEDLENMLSNFIDAIAILIVTSCLIPVGVLLFFVWIIKIALNINLPRQK